MNETSNWLAPLQQGFAQFLNTLLNYLPQLVGALLLILGGWLIAALLRMLTIRALRALAWFLPRILPGTMGQQLRRILHPPLFGNILFWVVILAFVAMATKVLGLNIFVSWLDALFSRLPQIILAIVILISSAIISQLARESADRAAAAARLEYHAVLGYVVQFTILITAAVIALDLIGLDITFLVVVAATLLGGVSVAAALAFGLGAQSLVRNLLGVRSLQQHVREGDAIRIHELEGRIVELGKRQVVLETRDGRVTVPGSYFNDYPCTLLMREDRDD